jgi:hypothetical protein
VLAWVSCAAWRCQGLHGVEAEHGTCLRNSFVMAQRKKATKRKSAQNSRAPKKKSASKRKSAKKSSAAKKKKATPWERPAPADAKHTQLTEADKTKAKKRASRAGRPYPNLVDNMNVAKKKGSAKKKTAPRRKAKKST